MGRICHKFGLAIAHNRKETNHFPPPLQKTRTALAIVVALETAKALVIVGYVRDRLTRAGLGLRLAIERANCLNPDRQTDILLGQPNHSKKPQ